MIKSLFHKKSKIEDIDWKKFGVDYVFECTGKFNSKEKLLAHINNGAKKLLSLLLVKMLIKQLFLV
jgi:glyceraldehyde 3-phosphate dehydrogenase